MSPHTLIRWSGLAAALGGLALILFALLHPDRNVSYALEPFWVWEHQLGVIAFVLIPFGLIGLYGVQVERAGWLGLLGFVLAFAGTILYMGGIFMDTYFFPTLAAEAPQVVYSVLTAQLSGAPLIGLGLGSGAFTLGLMVLGLVTWRAGTLPRWSGLLLIVGAPLFGPGSALPNIVQVGGAVILGAGLIWAGYAVWTTRQVQK